LASFVSLNPSELSGVARYDLLVGSIQPRPIAFVSTLSPAGIANLAPFSYFMPGGSNPMSLCFSVSGTSGPRKKDTLTNIEATGEFCVNLLVREMANGMNATSFPFDPITSEWPASGFHAAQSILVAPPRVLESPVQLECRLHQVVSHGEGSGSANYVVGEIVMAHVREDLWASETLNGDAFRPISRLGGENYLDTAIPELFHLPRPS
jgi:flavin reductase (DIM6/NTAB) family NADH-FMN oxidoreductase RutF